MKSIAATEANRHFSRILREVSAGETYTITSRGEPVATVAPIERQASTRRKALETLPDEAAVGGPPQSWPIQSDDAYDE